MDYDLKKWHLKLKHVIIRKYIEKNQHNYHSCDLLSDIINRDFTINSLLLPSNKIMANDKSIKWKVDDNIDLCGYTKLI